jgi:hypothetical protein
VRLLALVACVAACGDNTAGDVTIVTQSWSDVLADFEAVGVSVSATPPSSGFEIDVTDDASIPAEGYQLVTEGQRLTVSAHDVLGAQYGVAAALEHLGYRFRHPFDPYIPVFRAPTADSGGVHTPQIRVRGLHLHTLHPIESHYAFWLGGNEQAHRIIDWIVWNRGNYLQWAALDDILDPTRRAEWAAATREIIDYAHARGVRVGINVQLFAKSSIQRALTLVDNDTTPIADQVAGRLPVVTDGLPFDVVDISFGEFFDADPQAFVDALDEATAQIHQLAPAAEVHALIHVGGTQRVTYMGRDMPYYFLVQYADPSIIPDIHTVMYYDLFEDAGGAYQMSDFHEHRQYLLDRMCAHQPAAYHPETAYWIAFDDSVPQFLPLYVRSRLYDLSQLRASAPPPCGPLDDHLIFSSGWEWGYWLHDTTALRGSYELPFTPGDAIAEQLAPELDAAAPIVAQLADVQHDALITQHLAPYLASRDALIDAGRSLDIISQPDRVTFDDLVAGTTAPDAFASDVMTPLVAYAQALDALDLSFAALRLPEERWARELADGFAIDRTRAHFIYDAYAAVLAHLAGDDVSAQAARDRAAQALDEGAALVASRHADRHDADPLLVTRNGNSTTYGFGYLYFADQLCYWHRELTQVDSILGNTTAVAPACVL